MSHRLPRRACLSYPGWVSIPLLSPINASCPTSSVNASSKTVPAWLIRRKSVVLLSTHLTPAQGQASGENEPIAMSPRTVAFLLSCLVLGCEVPVPPFAQPYSCSRKSAAGGNPLLSLGQCPKRVVALWFFPLTGWRLQRVCMLHYSF